MKPLSAPTPESGARKIPLLPNRLHLVALAAILFLTLLNGFFNSLEVEYGGRHLTFLDNPLDRHADLIKAALTFPPFGPDFVYHRDEPYASFYLDTGYKGMEGIRHQQVTAFHLPPLIIASLLFLKRAILSLGPVELVRLFYLTALTCLAYMVARLRRNFPETLLIFFVLTFSYPFLMILSRGNYSALIISASLFLFLHELFTGRRIVPMALLLALAFNCRPNVVFFLPLLLILGWRDGLRTLLLFGAAATALFFTSYVLSVHFYPGYNASIFSEALKIYYQKYVIGNLGDAFNNSIYGGLKPFVELMSLPDSLNETVLNTEMTLITLLEGALILLSIFYYARRQITAYEYAFAISALYILGSPICGTYHLFFLFIFVLIFARRSIEMTSGLSRYSILAASILLLSPKNYFYYHKISWEVTLNPLILLATLVLLFLSRSRVPRDVRFRQTFHWNANEGLPPLLSPSVSS